MGGEQHGQYTNQAGPECAHGSGLRTSKRLKDEQVLVDLDQTAGARFWSFAPAARPGVVRYAAESGSELSCRVAPGTNTMTEAVSSDGSPVAKPVSRRRSSKPAPVSASALAMHLDCS